VDWSLRPSRRKKLRVIPKGGQVTRLCRSCHVHSTLDEFHCILLHVTPSTLLRNAPATKAEAYNHFGTHTGSSRSRSTAGREQINRTRMRKGSVRYMCSISYHGISSPRCTCCFHCRTWRMLVAERRALRAARYRSAGELRQVPYGRRILLGAPRHSPSTRCGI
jgi:hypothetical protein